MRILVRCTGLLLFLLLHLQCKSKKIVMAYTSENLKIKSISENSFIHISYLDVADYGKVACNGLVYLNDNEAVIFDTPADSNTARELIKWVVEVKQCDVTAVVINHFHDDCLGGLDVFHELGTPSFANSTTIALAAQEGVTAPQIGFEQLMELEVGNEKIVNRYFGEAHTQDNIVSYIPSEELLFGGCMIKSLNAKKGNLADANEKDWSATVSKIKAAYPKLKTVVPGHGAHNGTILLDYTIGLFTPDK